MYLSIQIGGRENAEILQPNIDLPWASMMASMIANCTADCSCTPPQFRCALWIRVTTQLVQFTFETEKKGRKISGEGGSHCDLCECG